MIFRSVLCLLGLMGLGQNPVQPIPAPKPVLILDASDKPILSVAYSPDGKRIATGSAGGDIHVWDSTSGDETVSLTFQYSINGLAFIHGNTTLMSASWNCQVWDLPTAMRTHHIEAHVGFLTCAAVSPDGSEFVTGGLDNCAKVRGATDMRERKHLPHVDQVNAVAYSPDGKWLAVTGVTTLSLHKTAGWSQSKHYKGLGGPCVAWSPKSDLVAAGMTNGSIRLIKPADGAIVAETAAGSDPLVCIAWHRNGPLIASYGSGTLKLFSTPDLKLIASWKLTSRAHSAATSPTLESFTIGCADGSARVFALPLQK